MNDSNIICCKNKSIYNNNKYLNEIHFEERKEKEEKKEKLIEIKNERKIKKQKLIINNIKKKNINI